MCGQAVNTSNSGSGGPEPLARCVVSLGKELFSTLSLFTQLYKWLAVTYCLGGNPADGLLSRPGRSSNSPRLASYYGNQYKLRPCGHLACVHHFVRNFW